MKCRGASEKKENENGGAQRKTISGHKRGENS